MTIKMFGSLLLSILLLGCAKPNYAEAQDPTEPANPPAEDTFAAKCPAHFSSENLCLKLKWEKKATAEETGSFLMQFFEDPRSTSSMVPRDPQGGAPKVILWMPSMGHGSSPVKVEKIETGRYRASEVFFVMPGAWEIRIKLPNGEQIVEKIEI